MSSMRYLGEKKSILWLTKQVMRRASTTSKPHALTHEEVTLFLQTLKTAVLFICTFYHVWIYNTAPGI